MRGMWYNEESQEPSQYLLEDKGKPTCRDGRPRELTDAYRLITRSRAQESENPISFP